MTGYICALLKLAIILVNLILKSLLYILIVGSASENDVSEMSPVEIMFSAGEAPTESPVERCTTDILIEDDSEQELDETFHVFISSPTDCLGNPSFAEVTIQDDDSGR